MTKRNMKHKSTEFHWFDFKTPLTRPAEQRGNGTADKGAGVLDGGAGNDWKNEEWRAAA